MEISSVLRLFVCESTLPSTCAYSDLILYHLLLSSICRIPRAGAGTRAQGATTGGRRRCKRASPRSFQLLQKLRTVQQCHLVPAITANLFIALNNNNNKSSNSKRSTRSSSTAVTPHQAAASHDVVAVVVQCRIVVIRGVMANFDAGKPVCAIILLRANWMQVNSRKRTYNSISVRENE